MNTTTLESPSAALTLPQRAAVALGTTGHEVALRALLSNSAGITSVTNADGRDEAHRAGMTLRGARTSIQKVGKLAREDATAFSKAVIAEEARLIAMVSPEEDRVLGLRDGWDAVIAAEKAAKIAAERDRVETIQSDIEAIKNMATMSFGQSIEVISATLEILSEIDCTEARFAEYVDHATAAVSATTTAVTTLLHQAIAKQEADRQHAAEQAAAAEHQRAEAVRVAAEREALAAERAALAATQAAANAQIKVAQDRLNTEQAAFAKEQADRLAADIARVEQIAKDEAQRVADEAKVAEPVAVVAPAAALTIVSMIDPTDNEIIEVVAAEFCMTPLEAIDRMARIDFLRALLAAEAA
jgi:hypothetical protein